MQWWGWWVEWERWGTDRDTKGAGVGGRGGAVTSLLRGTQEEAGEDSVPENRRQRPSLCGPPRPPARHHQGVCQDADSIPRPSLHAVFLPRLPQASTQMLPQQQSLLCSPCHGLWPSLALLSSETSSPLPLCRCVCVMMILSALPLNVGPARAGTLSACFLGTQPLK